MRCFKDGIFSALSLRILMCILLVVLLSADHCRLMGQTEEGNGVLRARSYKFNYITSQRAQEMLSQLNIGTSYDELSDDVLIVASNRGSDLVKASEVLSVLDQPEPVGIWVLLVGSDKQPLPDLDVLSARMQGFTVGTMQDAPPKGSPNPVILAIINNKLIGIAAEKLLPEIQKEVDAWKKANTPETPAEEPTQKVIEPARSETETEAAEGTAAESQETEPSETGSAVQPTQAQPDLSLEEIMSRLMEQEDEMAVPEPQAEENVALRLEESEPNTTDDYFGDELLRVLLDEEKKNRPQIQTPTEPAKEAVAVEPGIEPSETEREIVTQPNTGAETANPGAEAEQQVTQTPDLGDDKALKEAIRLLLQGESEEPTQQDQQTTQTEKPAAVIQRPEAVSNSEWLRMQRENAILRQQNAALRAQQLQPPTPPAALTGPEPDITEPEQGAEEPEPKILTEGEPELTEFEKGIGENELETIVNVPQEVELDWLVELVGKQLGLNYMYDPAILRNQKVTLKIHNGEIKVKDLYSLLESVMRFKNYVMTRRGNLVTILKATDVNQIAGTVDTVFRMPGDPIQPGDIIVSTIFRLNYISTSSAKAMLTNMRLGMSNGLQEIPETNTLIVTDYAYRMSRIEEVLQMIDVAGEEKEFQYRVLKYMQATDLISKLQELVDKMEGVSMQTTGGGAAATSQPTRYTTTRRRDPETGRIETVRVPITTPATAANPATAASKNTVFIDTDERTNRILMIGSKEQIKTINQLIDTLDVPQYGLKFVREYVIKHVEAVEVVNGLDQLGLADLQVSGASAANARSSTAARAAAARTARTATTNPAAASAAAPSAPSVSGSEDQPNILIRPSTNSLLVNATEEQHQAIELVIAHIDVEQKDQRQIREYEIQNVDTQEIIDTMTELGIISTENAPGATTTQQRRNTASARQPAAAQPDAAAGPSALTGLTGGENASEDITAQEPRIAVLEATNSLLVYATPRQQKAIALLIAHADRVPVTTTTPYVVYSLENQDPAELSEVLTKLIQETVEEVGATSTPESRIQTARSANAAGGTGGPPTREEQDIKIIPDEPSYSLIVYANKRNQQWIADLIGELDQYRPQVLLDCTLVQVTKDDAFKYELDLVSKTYSDLDLRPGTSGSIGGTGTTIGNLGGSTSFDSRTYAQGSSGAGILTGFFNTDMIQAVLTAMQQNQYGRIMARPKILVNDNQEGEIKTEDIQAVAQITTNVIPGTATQTSTTSQSASFTDYIAGVTLTIKPHISKGDMLRLEITLNRTDFGTTERTIDIADGAGGTTPVPYPPNRSTTDITTVSTIPDGTTIILGGLEKLKQDKLQSKIPILGDLPLIGGLFRDVSDTDTQGKLYVFVKANILRPSDQIGGLQDIRRVSGKYRDEFEDMEKKFQEMQDWPGIDPEPMNPIQVLEEDEGLTENNELSR